jgi:hypothetical protein
MSADQRNKPSALERMPVAGGSFAQKYAEYVPLVRQQRLEQFVDDLADRFAAEQDRVDREFMSTREYEGMAEEVLDRVQQRKNEDKYRYWAALLIGVAKPDRPAERDRERLVDTLDALRLPHLRLLHVIATTKVGPPDTYMGNTMATLKWRMPEISEEDARRDWGDLAREEVVQAFPSGMMTAQGAGDLTVRLTDYGRRFVKLLDLESESLDGQAAPS